MCIRHTPQPPPEQPVQAQTSTETTQEQPNTENTDQTKINMRNLNMNIVEAAEQSERLTLPKLNEVVN